MPQSYEEISKCCGARASWNFCFKSCYKCGKRFEPETSNLCKKCEHISDLADGIAHNCNCSCHISQRDADKREERDCIYGCDSDCKICPKKKPQANVWEWETSFDEKFIKHRILHGGENYPRLESIETTTELKDFIRSLLSTTSAQKLEGLERSVEGLLIPNDAVGRIDGEYYIDTPEQKEAWNYTINQVLKIIK